MPRNIFLKTQTLSKTSMNSLKKTSNQTTLTRIRTLLPNCPETPAKDHSTTMILAITNWMGQSLLSQAKHALIDKLRTLKRLPAKANQLTTKICSFLAVTGKPPEISWTCRSLNSWKHQNFPTKTSVIRMRKESLNHSSSLW